MKTELGTLDRPSLIQPNGWAAAPSGEG